MQPQNLSCAECGAELLPDGRFCRRCGHPSNSRASVTEVTTRRLEAQDRAGVFTEGAAGEAAPLERAAQGQTRQALGVETQALATTASASTLKRWLPGLIILFIAIALPALYVLRQWQQKIVVVVPPETTPGTPPAPPRPPSASAATETTTRSGIDPRFIYPGARTTMVISRAGEGDMVRLQTDDSLEKVADWYMERLKPREKIVQTGSVILRTAEVSAVITSNGKGTNIMLRRGAD